MRRNRSLRWRLLVFRREMKAEADTEGLTGFVGLILTFDAEKKLIKITDTLKASQPVRLA